MRTHLLAQQQGEPRAPVRIHVGGADEWRDLDNWPPPDTRACRLYLHPGNGVGTAPPTPSAPDRYRYDPADPTPSLGGPVLFGRKPVVDNAPLERRADVLTYTTQPLDHAVEAIGPVEADIYIRSSVEHFDVFVRICDVDRAGISRNVCDALERVEPSTSMAGPDGVRRRPHTSLADRPPVRRGAQCPDPVVQRRPPSLRPQSGDRGTTPAGHPDGPRRSGGLHEPGRASAVVLSVVGTGP